MGDSSWSLHIDRKVQKFCEDTGKPKPAINCYWIKDAEGFTVQLLTGFDGGPEERRARLIAAAPELLALIERAQELAIEFGEFNEWLQDADALLAELAKESR